MRDAKVTNIRPFATLRVLGLIYLGYLYARHPQRVTEVGLVHLEEPTEG